MVEGEWVSVIDVANHHGFLRATVFKILSKLGIQTKKERSSPNGGQAIAYITQEDYQRVVERLTASTAKQDVDDEAEEQWSAESGVFYLIQLEPEMDPARFKVGSPQACRNACGNSAVRPPLPTSSRPGRADDCGKRPRSTAYLRGASACIQKCTGLARWTMFA